MPVTLNRPDGLHILAKASLRQLAADEALLFFADGLISKVLTSPGLTDETSWTLAEALRHSGSKVYALLVVLLVLDAEVNAMVDDKTRVFPLPGFLSYRHRLPPDTVPLNTLRLPPLNPDGHYISTVTDEGSCLAVRMDIHPRLKVVGHVRIAASSPARSPVRMQATEHRLERQKLEEELIKEAVMAGSKQLAMPLTPAEQAQLVELLRGLIGD